jgi:uncharacterized membrane protein YsdA (DUF1294 family)
MDNILLVVGFLLWYSGVFLIGKHADSEKINKWMFVYIFVFLIGLACVIVPIMIETKSPLL